MSRRYRGFDPTQVPPVPVEIDWSQPGTDGIAAYWLLNNGLAIDLSGNCAPGIASTSNNTFLQGGPRGPNQYFDGGYFNVGFPPSLDFPQNAPMSIEALVIPWDLASTSPQTIFCGGYTGTTSYQLGFSGSGDLSFITYVNSTSYGANWAYGSALSNGQQFHVYADYDGVNWNLWVNGALVNSTASTTGPQNTATPVTIAAIYYAGSYLQAGNVSLSNLIVRRGILTGGAVAARAGAPFSMLRPIRRRRLYSLPSGSATLSISAGIAGFTGVTALAASNALAVAAASPEIIGVTALAASNALAAAAASPEITGVIDMYAALAAFMSVNADIPTVTSNISISFPVALGRSIKISPTIRRVSPINNRNIFFSPRAAGDFEPYTIDFSEILFPGEKLSGVPSAICLTNDLILGTFLSSETSIIIPISGSGIVGSLSSIEVIITTYNSRKINLRAYVLTNPCVFHARDVRIGTVGLPSPTFSPRENGDIDEYQLDFSGWLITDETIILASITCLTNDLIVASPSRIGALVQWFASGAGTPYSISAFAISITTSLRGPVSFYCGVETR